MPIVVSVPVEISHTLAADTKAGEVVKINQTLKVEVPQDEVDKHLGSKFAKWATKEQELEAKIKAQSTEIETLKAGGGQEFAAKLEAARAEAKAEATKEMDGKLKTAENKSLLAAIMAEGNIKLTAAYAATITVEPSDTRETLKRKAEEANQRQAEDLKALGITAQAVGNPGNGGSGAGNATKDAKLLEWSKAYWHRSDRSLTDAERIELMKGRIAKGLCDPETGKAR